MTSNSEPPKAPKSSSWWQTFPGVLTAITGTITALAGLVAALNQAGVFPKAASSLPPVNQPSPDSNSSSAGQPFPSAESNSPPDSVVPTAKTDSQPSGLLPAGMEVKVDDAAYKVLAARSEPLNVENLSLRFTIRCTNYDRFPMNFWNSSFRLLVNDVPIAPSNSLNEVIESQSAKEGEVVFEVPISTQEVVLKIVGLSGAATEIPFDLSTAKP